MIQSLFLSLAMLVPQGGPAEQAAKFGAWPIYKNDSILRVPEKVEGEIGDFIRVTASTETKIVKWACLDKVKLDDGRVVDALQLLPLDVLKDSRTAFIVPRAKGSFRLLCWTALADTPSDLGITLVVVGGAPPIPPGPEPGPEPSPNPPTPTPAKALRVILVRESANKLTAGQDDAWNSTAVADYLDSKCVDGKKGWRRWDKDTDVTNETPEWKTAWGSAKANIKTVPAVVILDGANGQIFPFPANEAELLAMLKKAGG